jgi:hypothetical protein
VVVVLIAAKFNEDVGSVPSVAELHELADNLYSPQLIRETERLVLQSLGWRVATATPYMFLEHFMDAGIVFCSDVADGKPATHRTLRSCKRLAVYFVDCARQDALMQQFRPSLVAAAAVFCARRVLRVSPVWTPELQALSQHSLEALCPAIEILYVVVVGCQMCRARGVGGGGS